MKINRYGNFYIQRMKWNYDQNTDTEYIDFDNDSRPVDIEDNYDCIYSECKGIEDVGKAKNIHTESYADSPFLRAYIPKKIMHEATDITLTLYFIGDSRQANLRRFINDISGGSPIRETRTYGNPYRYYDKIRKKGFDFVYVETTSVEEDNWKGSLPYIKASFKLLNIYGESLTTRTINVEDYE
jgi:hypothetical protein